MNGPQMQQQGPGMPPGMPQGGPVPPSPSLMQSSVSQPPAQEKLDNISKVKVLVNQLRESINSVIKHSTSTLQHNIMMDMGIKTQQDSPTGHFDKVLEEFYSLCDQTEIHLKTSIECLNQGNASNRYLPMMVASTRTEPLPNQDANTLTYPQYLNTVKTQVAFTKDVHDILASAAQNINSTE